MGQAKKDNYNNETNNILLNKFANYISLNQLQIDKKDSQSKDHWKLLLPDQLKEIENNARTYKNSSTSQISRILANQEGIKTMTFGYATGHKTGLLIANRENQSLKLPIKKENSYASFWSKHDYSIAKQIDWHGIIKGAIDDYFNDSDMSPY